MAIRSFSLVPAFQGELRQKPKDIELPGQYSIQQRGRNYALYYGGKMIYSHREKSACREFALNHSLGENRIPLSSAPDGFRIDRKGKEFFLFKVTERKDVFVMKSERKRDLLNMIEFQTRL